MKTLTYKVHWCLKYYIKSLTNTKHNQSLKCHVCGKMFVSKDLMEDHTILDHIEFEAQGDTSFVFSESMLDEYLP